MRSAWSGSPRWAVLTLVALAACNRTDPLWNKPCDQRGTPSVQMGIGQFTYVPLGNQGPLVDTDLQNGDFIWLGVGCKGMGPDVSVNFGIKDAQTGEVLSHPPEQHLTLSYDASSRRDLGPGLQAWFDPAVNTEQSVGRAITVWADVSDACYPASVHGERASQIEGFDVATCPDCIAQQCHAELAACDDDCHALQGCLDAYCVGLSATASPDEDLCQQFCQSEHAASKDAHIAVVTCVQDLSRGGMCNTQSCLPNPIPDPLNPEVCYVQPPCYPYSIDYRHCENQQNDPENGPCSGANDACNANADCQSYKTCIKGCTTWAACQACSATAAGAQGEALFEAHEACVEKTCLAQGWLPHI